MRKPHYEEFPFIKVRELVEKWGVNPGKIYGFAREALGYGEDMITDAVEVVDKVVSGEALDFGLHVLSNVIRDVDDPEELLSRVGGLLGDVAAIGPFAKGTVVLSVVASAAQMVEGIHETMEGAKTGNLHKKVDGFLDLAMAPPGSPVAGLTIPKEVYDHWGGIKHVGSEVTEAVKDANPKNLTMGLHNAAGGLGNALSGL